MAIAIVSRPAWREATWQAQRERSAAGYDALLALVDSL